MKSIDVRRKAKIYSAVKLRLFITDILLYVILLCAFQFLVAKDLSAYLLDRTGNFYMACAFFSFIFMVSMRFLGLPLDFVRGFLVEKYFKLSNETLWGWLFDEAKSFAISLILSLLSIQVFYLVIRNFVSSWWLILSVVWIFFSVVITKVMPVVFLPLFYKYLPLENDDLKQRVLRLAEKGGIKLLDVCRIDFSRKTVKANAALIGLGRTRRVILGDTLSGEFTNDEVETVVAHEFGHFKLHHMWSLLGFSAAITVLSFYVLFGVFEGLVSTTGASAIWDFSLLPILMLMSFLAGFLMKPVYNLYSRVLESSADRYALQITGEPDVFISMMTKLADRNLSDMEPGLVRKIFFYDHPPIRERIKMAEIFKAGMRSDAR